MSKDLRIYLTLSRTSRIDLDIASHLLQFSSGTGKTERSNEVKRLLLAAIQAEAYARDYGRPAFARNAIRPFIEADQLAIAPSEPAPPQANQAAMDPPARQAVKRAAAASVAPGAAKPVRQKNPPPSPPDDSAAATPVAVFAPAAETAAQQDDEDFDPVSDCLQNMFGA